MTTIREASLVLTVLNEAQGLPDFLSSLSAQTVLAAEVVVVDGGSSDGTVELLRAWPAPHGCELRVVELAGASISEGRNHGISLASHDKILVTDGGTQLGQSWIEKMLAAFDRAPAVDVVSGWFRPVGESLLERAIAFTVTPTLSEIDTMSFLPSSRSIAYTRSAWAHVGGYPEWLDYCEDLVFDFALKREQMIFVFEPGAVVTWSARPTLRAFMKQYFRYARGDGKAGLWPRRHAIRYATYVGGAALLAAGFRYPAILLLLFGGFLVYVWKFWIRVVTRRREFGRGWRRATALVPIIVVAGDLAKMCGYPAGVRWRSSRHVAPQRRSTDRAAVDR